MTDTPADQGAVKDFWLECVKGANSRGHLDRIPTRKAVTRREQEQARVQNYALTRSVFGMPDGYERIKWHSQGNDVA